ncbi:major facilitator superfamily domain-containing protein [Mycena metata]|uniref:Major facilitator superfamily domain-containing protein n=1 Tax=Mycena metata TaxID=1033252 RepID=A0AAD7H257_9AGAR|nr:major facilitator superfamily domain-containing protein [Mycena metata]
MSGQPAPEISASPDQTLRESSIRSAVQNEKVQQARPEPEESTILTGRRLAVVFVAMLLSLFLIALDQTILATALPRIASDFDSFTLQGWISSSFTLAQTVTLLLRGQTLRVFPAKWVLVSAIAFFEIGSLVCGLGRNVAMLIAGRIRGPDVSILQITAQVSRLEDRPRLFALFGAVFALSSVIGPLIGGAFTDHVTWQWVRVLPPFTRSTRDIFREVLRLDYVGAVLVAGAVTTLVLEWRKYQGLGDKDVIISFVFAAILTVVFIGCEIHLGEGAMVPTAIFKSRSIYAIEAYAFLNQFSLLIISYYIPIYYQAARAHSATKSGIDLLPFMLGTVITIIIVGSLVGRFGYYWPFLVGATVFLAIGSGLLYTIDTNTSSANLIGFQILVGIGIGMGLQNTLVASQVDPSAHWARELHGINLLILAGTPGLGVAESVFSSEFSKYLFQYAPEAPAGIVKDSPTAIYAALSNDVIPGVVRSYTSALRIVFVLGAPVAGLALIATIFINNIHIPKEVPKDAPVSPERDVENGSEG